MAGANGFLAGLLMRFALGLGRFIKARLIGWGFIVLLAVVAYFSARLALDSQPKSTRIINMDAKLKHAPDFIVKQFTTWRSSLDGRSQYTISAASMVHFRDDLSSELIKPDIRVVTVELKAGQVAPVTVGNPSKHARTETHIKAATGLIRNDGELIQLTNDVVLTRNAPNTPRSSISSQSLVLMPDTDWVVTRSTVTLTQGKNITTAQGGLEYSQGDAELNLIGPVTMRLPPK